jgi:hypothetical protein
MAGGIFPGKPFTFNIKCIIFSLIVMALFLYKPTFKSNWMLALTLFVIFVVAYVAMAWYDWVFDCKLLPLERGSGSFTGMFKPPPHESAKQLQGVKSKAGLNVQIYMIYLAHVLIFSPLIGYVAIYGAKSNPIAFPLLGALTVFTLGYHGGHLIARGKSDFQ